MNEKKKVDETWWANVVLVLFSLIVGFAIGEIGVRSLELNKSARALMFSTETFHLDQHGAVRYLPDTNMRMVAVYNGKIEYDVNFHTNNLGFIDSEDYEYEDDSKKSYYAFVGDSFTAGVHGGEPWVPRLRKEFRNSNVEIYNLGISATGVEHFYRLLKSVADHLRITHIVILAISNDFDRGFWYPLTNLSEIRFCGESVKKSECSDHPPVARIIPPASSNEEILKVADSIVAEKENTPDTSAKNILKRSELLVFIVKTFKELMKERDDKRIEASFGSLKKIKDYFPATEIDFIHLPEKYEVADGHYSIKKIEKRIREIGITYFPALTKCKWASGMFFVHDGHPNKLGYENVEKCVSGYLFPHKERAGQ
jgi:hypothetical protein